MKPGWMRALLPAVLAAGLLAQGDDASCRACHPGPAKGLASSPHGVLLQRADLQARSCTACHGDLSAHVQSARRPGEGPLVHAAPVAAQACAACHKEGQYAVGRGAHPQQLLPPPQDPGRPSDAPLLAELERSQQDTALQWSGLLEAGYRFVSRHG